MTRTPVPSRTSTLTPTKSRTPTRTATATKTNTPSRSRTPTKTATRITQTRTYTKTVVVQTLTPNRTKTATPTPTRTNTHTYTPTRTGTVTQTRTPSATATHTRTPTATATPMLGASSNPNLAGMAWKFYYLAGSERIAMRVITLWVIDGGSNQLYYLFTDHLGSTSEVRRADGTLHSRQYYMAFGEERLLTPPNPDLPTDRTYTGQREIEFGLVQYGARIYDPLLARWVQPDTIIPQPGNPMAWDRYSYTLYNPIRYNDPNGHDVGCAGTDASNCSSLNTLVHHRSADIKMDITLNLVVDVNAIQQEVSSDKDYAQVPVVGNQTISIGSPESIPDPFGAANSLLGPSAELKAIQASPADFFATIHMDVYQNTEDPSLFVFTPRAVDFINSSSAPFEFWALNIGDAQYTFSGEQLLPDKSLRLVLNNANWSFLSDNASVTLKFWGQASINGDAAAGIRGNKTVIYQALPFYLFRMESDPGGGITIE